MLRNLLALLLALAGGVGSQVAAESLHLHGLAAYGFFLACVAVIVLIAVPLSLGLGPREHGGSNGAPHAH